MKSREDKITIALRKQYLLNLKQPTACLNPDYKPKIPDELFPSADILVQAYELCLKLLNLNILLTLNTKHSPSCKNCTLIPKAFFFLNSNSVQSNIYRNVIQRPCVYVHNMLSASDHLAIARLCMAYPWTKRISAWCAIFLISKNIITSK